MNMPRFTADISLYRRSEQYYLSPNLHLTGSISINPHIDLPFLLCGALGEACCRAPTPSQNVPAFGPLVSCQQGLGCDITTNKCVSPCGGTGQVCCDGPETRALKWTADGKIYAPAYGHNPWNAREMCDAGACDKQTHRCFTCGIHDGDRCCPPDAAQATARCVGDSLECEFDPQGFSVSGTCRACGRKGRPPCRWGCDTGLDIRNGLCDICGGDFQPPCDKGCRPGLGLTQGLCRQCGNVGQIPCNNGCYGGLRLKNGLCAVCGGEGQLPCAGMTCQGDLHLNIDMLSKRLLCTAYCGHFHQYACRTTYPVPDGVRSRYRCFNHSKLFATGPADPSNCLCVPNTINDRENDVSDDSGFCISTFPAPGDIADPPDCDDPACSSKHEG